MGIKIWYLALSAVYYFTTTFIGFESISYLIFYGIPLVYICLNIKYLKQLFNITIKSYLKYFLLFLVILIIMSLTIPVFQQTFDFSYFSSRIMTFPKELIRIVFLIIIFLKYVSPEGDYKLFIKYYLLSCCLYVLFTCVLLVLPDFKMFLYELIKESEHSKVVALQADYVTRYGWSGFSGFEHTLKCTWGVALSLYLILDDVKGKNFRLYVICGILLLGNMFYGRSGMLVSLIMVLVFAMIILKKRTKVFTVLLVFAASGCLILIALAFFNTRVAEWFEWAFALFINFFETGRFGTVSTDILLNKMIFLPEFKTIILGDGKYIVDSLYYMNTDVGFMRPMLFGGILFLCVRYLVIISMYFAILNKIEEGHRLAKRFIIFCFIIILVLFEMKGEIVFPSINILLGIAILINYKGNQAKYK